MSHLGYGSERVVEMPPLTLRAILSHAEAVVGRLQPQALLSPQPVRLDRLVAPGLYLAHTGFGTSMVSVYDTDDEDDLAECEGFTDFNHGPGRIDIVIASKFMDDFEAGGSRANRARSTLGHELGHADLHAPTIWRRMRSHSRRLRLARPRPRSEVKPYQQPEWQAWSYSGGLLMPLPALKKCLGCSPFELAEIFQVSPDFANRHTTKLRRNGLLRREQ